MKVTFEIEYRTKWGESLALVLADKKYPMSWTDGSVWTLTLDKVSVAALKELVIRDSWNDCPIP